MVCLEFLRLFGPYRLLTYLWRQLMMFDSLLDVTPVLKPVHARDAANGYGYGYGYIQGQNPCQWTKFYVFFFAHVAANVVFFFFFF